MAAQALHHLVLARSSAQWHQLCSQLPSMQTDAAEPGRPLWGAIPAPLARQRLFAVSVFATPVVLSASGSTAGGEDTRTSETVGSLPCTALALAARDSAPEHVLAVLCGWHCLSFLPLPA